MQIEEHASQLGQWRAAQRSAHPDLRAFVRGYFASTSSLPNPVRELHLPSAEVPLFLNFGAPHRQLDITASNEWIQRDGAWVVGLQEGHRLGEAAGERAFMIVRFTPLGAHHFLRTPMHLIGGRTVELAALDGKLAGAVMRQMAAQTSWDDRFTAMEAIIAERVAQAIVPASIALAWRQLEASDGRISLGRLVSEIGSSHRSLIAGFRTGIGVSPKVAGRLLRFNRAIRLLNGSGRTRNGRSAGKPFLEAPRPGAPNPAIHWADIAAACGYFDQSHFIKEFHRFAGTTPAEFTRRMTDAG